MNEDFTETWESERWALLLRLDHELGKPIPLMPGFREWVERCVEELRTMPSEKLPVEVPWRTHEFLVWLCKERDLTAWELELDNR
jgi:hypothetical protein